jgi:uncharacterized protein (DUF302 family)
MLPCNVIVQQAANGIEVSAVDPLAMVKGVENTELNKTVEAVRTKLKAVIDSL